MPEHDTPTEPILLTEAEAAARAGVTKQAVHGWFTRKRLQSVLTEDGLRVDAAELDRPITLRRAAAEAGVAVDTVLGWADPQHGEERP